MVNGLDYYITGGKEPAYGTAVTPTKVAEGLLPTPKLTHNQERLVSKALRSGSRFGLGSKSPIVFRSGALDFAVEAASKGQGWLWEAALGSGSSALVSGANYQQTFKMADVIPSYTLQGDLPLFTPATGVWSQNAFTFLGSVCTGWEVSLANGGILELKTTWDARSVSKLIALAAPSFPVGGLLYHFGGACIYSGTIAEPSATALIDTAGLTPIANVVSFNMKVDNALGTGEKRMCGGGLQARPLSGRPKGSGVLVTDYVSAQFTDAYFADTPFNLVADFVANSADATADHLQILIQDFRISGDLPSLNDGKPLAQSIPFDIFDKAGQTSPIIVVQRTTDTAI